MSDALAQIYSRSLFELADEAGGKAKVFEVASELEEICELGRADKRFAEFLASPIIDREKRGEALGRTFRDRVTDLTLRFLLVVNSKGRLRHLESINAAFDQLVQAAHGRVEVDVYTAAALGEEQLASIGDRIREALDREVVLHPYTDPSMMAGLKLRIGDQLIDGSVATRLRRIRHNLLSKSGAILNERVDQIILEGDAA